MSAGLSVGWKCSRSLLCSALFCRRIWFSRVISGLRLAGFFKSQSLISYFSESRYSSLPGLKGLLSPNSKAGPYIP